MAGVDASPNRGVMIVLAYLWLLALIPLLLEKHDPDVQWHAKHGLVLMIAEFILLAGYITLTSIVSLATLGLGCVLSILLVCGWIHNQIRNQSSILNEKSAFPFSFNRTYSAYTPSAVP